MTLWGLSTQAQSISDTIYYDRQWQKCTRDSFTFYRTFRTQKDLYLVTDHYHDGTVQMQGSYSSLDPDVKNGFFTYYFASGRKQEEGEYYNGKKRGPFRYYSSATGLLKSSIEYMNDKKNGSSIVYLNDGGEVRSYYRDNILISSRTVPATSKDKQDEATSDNARNPPGEQTILADIIRKKFELHAPDSLRKKYYKVTASFEVDTEGTIYNIRPVFGGNRWLNNLVIQSIKELPDLKSYGKTANGFTDAVYSFTVTFPQISIDKSTTMEYRSAAKNNNAAPSEFIDFSNDFFKSFKNNNTSFPEQLKKNVKLYLSDSMQQVAWTVRVSYDLDSTGRAENITAGQGDIKQLTDVVVQSIKEVYVSGNTKHSRSKNTLTVAFPSLSISEQSTLENGAVNNSSIFINSNFNSDGTNPSSQVEMDSLSSMLQKINIRKFLNLAGNKNDGTLLQIYFKNNYQQTPMASDSTISDSVVVRFEVDENGNLSNIELLAGKNNKLNDFVMDRVEKYNNWGPASRNGKVVKTIYRLSINFPMVRVEYNTIAKPE